MPRASASSCEGEAAPSGEEALVRTAAGKTLQQQFSFSACLCELDDIIGAPQAAENLLLEGAWLPVPTVCNFLMATAEHSLLLPGSNCPQLKADDEEELFSIVDENNHVIGQEKRSIVHKTGLKHRAVYCFVFNRFGHLLMQQRSARSAFPQP